MLRNLSSYYYKDPVLLYLVKVSQGLVHMGKGLMSVSPYHTERQLLSGEERSGGGVPCVSACLFAYMTTLRCCAQAPQLACICLVVSTVGARG